MELNDAAIRNLANRKDVIDAFPEFKAIAKQANGCSACQKTKMNNHLLVAKMALASLSEPRAQKLKSLLNADSITIKYHLNGKSVEKRI